MATADAPDVAPWTSGPSVPAIDVAGGAAAELDDADGSRSAAVALRLAVGAVRTTLLRQRCPHPDPVGPFCPECGVLRSEADRWRVLR